MNEEDKSVAAVRYVKLMDRLTAIFIILLAIFILLLIDQLGILG